MVYTMTYSGQQFIMVEENLQDRKYEIVYFAI